MEDAWTLLGFFHVVELYNPHLYFIVLLMQILSRQYSSRRWNRLHSPSIQFRQWKQTEMIPFLCYWIERIIRNELVQVTDVRIAIDNSWMSCCVFALTERQHCCCSGYGGYCFLCLHNNSSRNSSNKVVLVVEVRIELLFVFTLARICMKIERYLWSRILLYRVWDLACWW